MKYICGYKYGFTIANGKVSLIYPTKLNETKMFVKYQQIIKNILETNKNIKY